MKKIVISLLTLLVLIFTLSACTQPTEPTKVTTQDFYGGWEYQEQVWCEFYDNGYCLIGGIHGTYELDEETMEFSIKPNGSDQWQTFTWSDETQGIKIEQWHLADDILYLNGYLYHKSAQEVTMPEEETTSEN